MKKAFLFFVLLVCAWSAMAQVPGDTIVVNSFNYAQTYGSRDTLLNFPNLPGVTYEKILMLYNMRCKNGLVSPGIAGQTNIGCGEWDYTCNTYIVDSTRVDSTKAKHPSHIITGVGGTSYSYTTQPTYSYYQYTQQAVSDVVVESETVATIGAGTSNSAYPLNTAARTGKSQFLWTYDELNSAGLVAGNITNIRLQVSNAGSTAQFLKVRMRHTTAAELNAEAPITSGFTEVYFLNTQLVNGENKLDFYNAFDWNGSDNILVEFSFSNPTEGSSNTFLSDETPLIMGLVSAESDYSFEFTGSNQMHLGNTNFDDISNQISVAFWAYGNPDFLPANTSAVYAASEAGQREVNIHLPWSDKNLYWDCGNLGNYDRINKLMTDAAIEGTWNHWVFTKNATTGSMKIYLNGTVWHSGTGLTKPIQVSNFMLGAAPNAQNPYYGKMDEFSLWNVELSAANIQAWMNKTISSEHPNYANLLAYYDFNEGAGESANDGSVAANSASVSGPSVWRLTKGKDIVRNFVATNNRPMLAFGQAVGTQTVTPNIVLDSVLNVANTVYSYGVLNNNIVAIDTAVYYKSGYSYIYNGETGAKLDSVLISATGTINITQLDYFQKSPSNFQIMSFVTPYGINLDMGMEGKTWTFDVTDLAPVLKGSKRMFMNGGGERQEDMDIKFLFIVGTPPRDVKDVSNIWKVENVDYTNILNDNKFETRTVSLNAAASAFRIKTAITGHGQEGEFIPRTHRLNIDGGTPEFSWEVWKEDCSSNPVYPQGGTWIASRAGWCPGMATHTEVSDITEFVTPGSSVQMDYLLVTAAGASNYWVSNQLVSYGAPNFELDAAVIDVINPSTKIEYARTNNICDNPKIVIQNTGSQVLTSLTIEYWINDYPSKQSILWQGSLGFLETEEVVLPSPDQLWYGLTGAMNNKFHVEVKSPNNGTDAYEHNNLYTSTCNIPNVVPSDFIVWVKTNNVGSETRYKLLDSNGDVLLNRLNLSANTNYRDTMNLPAGCYSFVLTDLGGDGLDYWANNDGSGFARFRNVDNVAPIVSFEGDFGASLIYNFTVDFPLSYDELFVNEDLQIFPNPTTDQFTLSGKSIIGGKVLVYNSLGQIQKLNHQDFGDSQLFDSSSLPSGAYFVAVRTAKGVLITKTLIKE